MGKTFMGGSTHEKNVDLLTPEQKQFLSSILGPLTGDAASAYKDFLQPYDPAQYNELFQKSVVDPTMQQYNQQVLPSIQQRFVDANAGSSSALNQALGQSATELGTMLGGQYGNFFNQMQQNRMNALGGLGGLASQRTFQPIVSQSGGILGPLIGAAGSIGAGAMMSSRTIKENICSYEKGLDLIKEMDVKNYDYIEKYGGLKNRVGLIAETVPEELRCDIEGIPAVDVYGLVGVLINAVKELSEKVNELEAKDGLRLSK